MEILIILAALGLFIWAANYRLKQVAEKAAAAKLYLENNRFRIRLRRDFIELDDGTKVDCLFIEAAGLLNAPCDDYAVRHSIRLSEKASGGGSRPIFCHMESWRSPDDHAPFFLSEPQKLRYKFTIINDWMRLGVLPFDCLVFSKRGLMEIECVASFFSEDCDNTIARASSTFKHTNTVLGYIDGAESKLESQIAAVKMAVLISGCDGDHGAVEGVVIKEWINKQLLETAEGAGRDALKTRLNGAIRTVFAVKEAGEIRTMLRELCRSVVANSATPARYAVVELLMLVAKADGTAAAEELSLIEEAGRHLGLDIEKTRALRDKILPVTIYAKASSGFSSPNDDSLLGIDPSMSQQEKLKKLNQEYRKWNGRADNADPDIRKQAHEMVALIARARQRHNISNL